MLARNSGPKKTGTRRLEVKDDILSSAKCISHARTSLLDSPYLDRQFHFITVLHTFCESQNVNVHLNFGSTIVVAPC